MESLIAACLFFLGMHWIISGSPLRQFVVKLFGEKLFKALFSLSIFIAIGWMSVAYANAPDLPTWGTAEQLKPVSLVLMLLAFLMMTTGATDKNPTTLGLVPPDQVEARGMVRITRNAGLFGLGLWGLAHFIVNGDVASHWIYGTFAFQGLIAPLNMERKYRARYGEAWTKFADQTSYIPFAAIITGRNKLVISELNIWGALTGLSLFLLVLWFHESWFGVSPLSY
ncbi:MAG: hypothetical protein JKY89_12120 [Immundisolibacteraceae bacterium]|nr:hypothetical protein [Immundisolibacteraceae bacterium]